MPSVVSAQYVSSVTVGHEHATRWKHANFHRHKREKCRLTTKLHLPKKNKQIILSTGTLKQTSGFKSHFRFFCAKTNEIRMTNVNLQISVTALSSLTSLQLVAGSPCRSASLPFQTLVCPELYFQSRNWSLSSAVSCYTRTNSSAWFRKSLARGGARAPNRYR